MVAQYLPSLFLAFSFLVVFQVSPTASFQSSNDGPAKVHFAANDTKTIITLAMPSVQPNQRESYLCTGTPINSSIENFIVKFMPNANRSTVHHMILFGCTKPGSSLNAWNCGNMHTTTVISQYPEAPVCKGKQLLMYAWALDAPGLLLPQDVGFRVGGQSGINYLVLQMHYLEPLASPDSSGLSVRLTQKQLPRHAGVVLMTTDGRIKAHSKEKFESFCPIRDDVELHPFAFRVHTHRLGKIVSGYVVNSDGWRVIGKRNPQEPQMFYPVANESLVLKQGDVLAARCTMENLLDTDVAIGFTSDDEMCNFYLMYWTNGNVTLSLDWCNTEGPPKYYWKIDPYLSHTLIPDADASKLP